MTLFLVINSLRSHEINSQIFRTDYHSSDISFREENTRYIVSNDIYKLFFCKSYDRRILSSLSPLL